MTIERRPVCLRCAQIKQACDGNIPCSRCTRLSLPCRPRNASVGTAGPYPPDVSTPGMPILLDNGGSLPKARIRRVQTGCLMCKQRKKKCDEEKPKCGDCMRLALDCCWPADRQKEVIAHKAARTKRESADQLQMQKQQAQQQAQQPQQPRQDSRPSSPTTRSTASPGESPTSIVIRQHTPVPSPLIAIKTEPTPRTTDLGAVKREPDSDEPPPCESAATTSPSWYDVITPISHHNYASPESMDHMSLSIYMPQMLPQLNSPYDRALMNHYATIVSSLLSRRSSASNPYNHYLLPMAQSNDLILHCILALSGNHWRKMQPSMGNRGLLHQSQATQALANLLPHVNKTSADVALVASLLLCMTELFDGTSEGWKLHLKGAKRLLAALRRQSGGNDIWTGYYKFLVRLSRFLDSAATVSTCRPPLMEEEARDAATVDGMTSLPDEEDSAVYGIPKELFHLVDQINSLADKRKTRVDAASEAAFRREAATVEERINHWSFEYGGLSRAVSTLAPADDDALHATMAFEHALRLRLHQIVEGYELSDPKVPQAVEGILECVQKIRYGSPLEACLMFPLVMAGGACYTLEQRAIIQDRLMVMERTCGFGYVFNARDLVERVWARRDQAVGTGAIVNWARIRYEEMHGLVVF
jgi:transcriptional activator protein UGA3